MSTSRQLVSFFIWNSIIGILLYYGIVEKLQSAYSLLFCLGCLRLAFSCLCFGLILIWTFAFLFNEAFELKMRRLPRSFEVRKIVLSLYCIIDIVFIGLIASQKWWLLCGIWAMTRLILLISQSMVNSIIHSQECGNENLKDTEEIHV